MIQINSTAIAKIKNQSDMDAFVGFLNLTSPHVVIKPNWVDGLVGSHTEARVLDMLLTSLNRPETNRHIEKGVIIHTNEIFT